jgi:hypothetical protein
MLHPTVRIATLIAFGAALAGRPPLAVVAGALAAIALALACGAGHRLLALLWRARWLLAIVAALHLLGTPGAPSIERETVLVPSRTGVVLALGKLALLVAMFAAVAALLETTPAAALAQGVAGACAPLEPLGVPAVRLGARLAATLEGLGAAQASVSVAAKGRGWSEAIADQVLAIEARAAAAERPAPAASVRIRAVEWVLPAAMFALAFAGRGP